MFTGIIEELGVVTSFIRGSQAAKITVSVSKNLADAKVGESIAINGVCLTITAIRRNFFEFDVSPESIKRSTLQDIKIGDKVNLERALKVAGRIGGHLVTGHVDGIGEVRKKVSSGKAFDLYISVPSEMLRYVVSKGSITVEGISLTVADIRDDLIVISLIPHSAKTTTLGAKNIGDRVNIEVDILSKYIEKHLRGQQAKGMTSDAMTQVGYLPMGWIDN
jgi:riboflavin synthase